MVSQHDDRIRVNDSVINMSELIKRLQVIHRTITCLFRRSLRRRLHRILSRRQSPMQPATKIPPKQQQVHLYLLSVMLDVYSENSHVVIVTGLKRPRSRWSCTQFDPRIETWCAVNIAITYTIAITLHLTQAFDHLVALIIAIMRLW